MSKNSELLREFDVNDIEKLNNAYKNHQDVDDLNGITINHKPFTYCAISNLIKDNTFIKNLKKELLKVKYKQKNNDLYKFHQTDDLSKSKSPALIKFKEILYGKFLNLLKELTSIDLLSSKIDMTSSKYEYTDYLLCHDDDIHGDTVGRRIAFVYYLVPSDWQEADGGQLDLYNVNENLQPVDVVKSLIPKENRLLFFEVSDRSFHQVSEVLSENKTRLSIHGWFHGPVNYRPQPHIEIMQNPKNYININHDLFFEWITEKYLNPFNQSQIQKKFAKNSEIRLEKFFDSEKYDKVSEALKSENIVWKKLGPVNRRNYEIADENTLPDIVANLVKVLTCEFMGLTLSNLTGLGLHSSCKKSDNNASVDEDDDDDDDDDDDEEGGKTLEDDEDNESSSLFDENSEDGDDNESKEILNNNNNDSAQKSDSKPGTSRSLSLNNEKNDDKAGTSAANDHDEESEPVKKKLKQEDGNASSANNDIKKDTEEPSKSTCHVEVRRWKPGYYTLITDDDHELQLDALDAILFFNTDDWIEDCGGSISYIARNEDDELLSIYPEKNCLALVYRDRETLKFTKYINSKFKSSFYEISLVYYE